MTQLYTASMNTIHRLTTSNIIIIGLFTKSLGSPGRGSIWSENIGEAGT